MKHLINFDLIQNIAVQGHGSSWAWQASHKENWSIELSLKSSSVSLISNQDFNTEKHTSPDVYVCARLSSVW